MWTTLFPTFIIENKAKFQLEFSERYNCDFLAIQVHGPPENPG